MELSTTVRIPDDLRHIWNQLGPLDQERMLKQATEWVEVYLRTIKAALQAPQKGQQPCAG
jgi:hypothetical protein